MCSVPLVWDEQVVGVLNVQTVEPREFTPARLRFLETLAGLLAALVEKSRLHAEAEAQIESLRAIDEARANLVAVVTHALRTPLAVVRAYVELLGGQARSAGSAEAATWEHEALAQVDRIDQTVDSILESLRVMPSPPAELLPGGPRHRRLRDHHGARGRCCARMPSCPPSATSPSWPWPRSQMLHRLLGYLLENASKYAPTSGRIDIYGWRDGDRARLAITDDGPGIPEAWRERIFEPFVRLDDSPRGAGIGLFAARHLARTMGGELTRRAARALRLTVRAGAALRRSIRLASRRLPATARATTARGQPKTRGEGASRVLRRAWRSGPPGAGGDPAGPRSGHVDRLSTWRWRWSASARRPARAPWRRWRRRPRVRRTRARRRSRRGRRCRGRPPRRRAATRRPSTTSMTLMMTKVITEAEDDGEGDGARPG